MSNMHAPPYDTTTSLANLLIARWDYGPAIIIAGSNSFSVDLDQAGGVFALL